MEDSRVANHPKRQGVQTIWTQKPAERAKA